MSTYRPKNNLRAQITLAACPRLGEYIPALVFNSGVVVVERFGGRLGEVGNFCNRGPRLRATCRVTLAVSRPAHNPAPQMCEPIRPPQPPHPRGTTALVWTPLFHSALAHVWLEEPRQLRM